MRANDDPATLDRLLPLAPARICMGYHQRSAIICDLHQLDEVPPEQVLCEPAARNTAPAQGLAASCWRRPRPDAVLDFPRFTSSVTKARFLNYIASGIALAAAGRNIVSARVVPTALKQATAT